MSVHDHVNVHMLCVLQQSFCCLICEGIDEGIDIGYSAAGGSTLTNSEAAANDRNARDMGAQV